MEGLFAVVPGFGGEEWEVFMMYDVVCSGYVVGRRGGWHSMDVVA